MGVEGGSIGGLGGGIGAGVGVSVGPGISAGPSISVGIEGGGLNNMFGPVMGSADIGPIVNEGPVPVGIMPTLVNEGSASIRLGPDPVEVINFQSPAGEGIIAESFSAESAIAEVESILSQARIDPIPEPVIKAEPRIIREASYWFVDVPEPQRVVKPAEVIMPKTEPKIAPFRVPDIWEYPKPQVKTENVVTESKVVEDSPAVLTQPALQEQIEETEEVVQEKIRVEEPEEELDKEKVIKLKKYLVDQPVLATVLSEGEQAYDQAEKEAEESGLGKKVLGSRLAELLPGQHEGNAGGAVKPHGLDGTISARREVIAVIREFKSKEEVKAVMLKIRPVTIGENGEEAKKEEVVTTFRDRIVKHPKVIEIVQERVVKKKKSRPNISDTAPVPVIAKQETETKQEPTIKDLGLAEIFQMQKAA